MYSISLLSLLFSSLASLSSAVLFSPFSSTFVVSIV